MGHAALVTLVLTIAAADVVIQTSDRRFVSLPSLKPIEERACKQIEFHLQGARGVLSYTGLARLGTHPKTGSPMLDTAAWLTHVLAVGATESWNDVADLLARTLTTELAATRVATEHKRQAVVMAGWDDGDTQRVTALSNFEASGNEVADEVCVSMDQSGLLVFASHGASMGADDAEELNALVDRRAAGEAISTWELVRTLVDAQRRLAIGNSTVGKSAYVSVLPRRATGGRAFVTDRALVEEPMKWKGHEDLTVFVPWDQAEVAELDVAKRTPYVAGRGFTSTDQGIPPWVEEYLRRRNAGETLGTKELFAIRDRLWSERGYDDLLGV